MTEKEVDQMATTNVLARAWYIISSISFLLPRLLSSVHFSRPFSSSFPAARYNWPLGANIAQGTDGATYADQQRVFDDLGQGVLNNAYEGFNSWYPFHFLFPPHIFSRCLCMPAFVAAVCLDVVFGQKFLCMFARWQYTLSILSPPLPYPNAYIISMYVCVCVCVYIYMYVYVFISCTGVD